MCLAQGHNAVMPVRLEPMALPIKVSNGLDPDQVGPDLGANSAKVISGQTEEGVIGLL